MKGMLCPRPVGLNTLVFWTLVKHEESRPVNQQVTCQMPSCFSLYTSKPKLRSVKYFSFPSSTIKNLQQQKQINYMYNFEPVLKVEKQSVLIFVVGEIMVPQRCSRSNT